MSHWFSHYDDSEDESTSSVDSSSSSESKDSQEGLKKWLKKDNKEIDNEDKGTIVLSTQFKREQKLLDLTKNICNSLKEENWSELVKNIKNVNIIIKKYGINSKIIETLNYLRDNFIVVYKGVKPCLCEEEDDVANSNKLKDANIQLAAFNKCVKLISKLITEYEYAINIFNRPTGEEVIDDHKEQSLKGRLLDIINNQDRDILQLQQLILDSKTEIDTHIQAVSLLTNILIHKINSFDDWIKVFNNIKYLVQCIKDNSHIIIDVQTEGLKPEKYIQMCTVLSLAGQLLYVNYIKLLQASHPETSAYNKIASYEGGLVILYQYILDHYKKLRKYDKDRYSKICITILSIMNLLYYKHRHTNTMYGYYKIIHKYGNNEEDKTLALFYYIYNLLVNNKYDVARELLLTSYHTMEQDSGYINTEEIAVLYNQLLAQIAFVAFKHGKIEDCFEGLNELCQDFKVNILLGQTIIGGKDHLLIPYHRHINVNMLKEIYLICCMLLDVPYEDNDSFLNRRPNSKSYASILYRYHATTIYGKIETMEEKMYMASRDLLKGEWQKTYDMVKKLDHFNKYDNEYILHNIKMSAFQSFITHGNEFYKNIYFNEMINLFKIEDKHIKNALSIHEEHHIYTIEKDHIKYKSNIVKEDSHINYIP